MADPISITISVFTLCGTFGMFAWQHLRKVDSAICTLVASNCRDDRAAFQFAVANLGTRALLLREVTVMAFTQPDLLGKFAGGSTTLSEPLPQVVKAGEICCTDVELKWPQAFLAEAQNEAKAREENDAGLYFVARAVAWNPKGERFLAEKHIATLKVNFSERRSTYQAFSERSFRIKKWRTVPKEQMTETVTKQTT